MDFFGSLNLSKIWDCRSFISLKTLTDCQSLATAKIFIVFYNKARVALERNQIFCNFWWGKNWPKFCKFQILAAVASNLNVLTKTLLIDTYVNHKPIWLLYLRSKEIVPSLRRQMILSQTLPVRAASIQNYTQGTVHRGSDRSPAHIPHLTLNNYRKSQMDRVKSYFVPPLRLPN